MMDTALLIMAKELDQLPEKWKLIWLTRNFAKYLELEKQQIINAWIDGNRNDKYPFPEDRAELVYYEQTYNQKP